MKLAALITRLQDLHSVYGDISVVFDYDGQDQQVIGAMYEANSWFWDESCGTHEGEAIRICAIGDMP